MRTKDLQMESIPKTNIKSKVRFKWIFADEIEKTVESLGNFLDKELDALYDIDYVDIWKRNIKIKVNDENKFIFRTINCVFDETIVDQKYGNSRIELTFSEMSQKPRYALVGKYNLLDRDEINQATLKKIIKGLEEIYE